MNSEANNLRIDGLGTVQGGTYNDIKIEGLVKIVGPVEFNRMVCQGVCTAKSPLLGKRLEVEGILRSSDDIKIKQLAIEGVVESKLCKIYADEIKVEGLLSCKGEVNADRVIINGCMKIEDLFGDVIEINYGVRLGLFIQGHFFKGRYNKAKQISCSKLYANNIRCSSILAQDIVLENHCVVDVIHCDGTLKYDSTCKIGEIQGDCVKKT